MPSDPPIGSIVAFAGPEANIPPNYKLCNGASVSRVAFPDLFNAIGFKNPNSCGWPCGR